MRARVTCRTVTWLEAAPAPADDASAVPVAVAPLWALTVKAPPALNELSPRISAIEVLVASISDEAASWPGSLAAVDEM